MSNVPEAYDKMEQTKAAASTAFAAVMAHPNDPQLRKAWQDAEQIAQAAQTAWCEVWLETTKTVEKPRVYRCYFQPLVGEQFYKDIADPNFDALRSSTGPMFLYGIPME